MIAPAAARYASGIGMVNNPGSWLFACADCGLGKSACGAVTALPTSANATVRDNAGPYEIDGRWFTDKADCRVDYSNSNVMEAVYSGTDRHDRCLVRRGFRGGKFVIQGKFKSNATSTPGAALALAESG